MLESATQIGKYRIIEKIGTGGMADVYEAEDILLRRTVAMKVLPPEFARDPERIQRFEKEIRNLAALDHPNIVTVYDVGCDKGYHFYTMTLLPNGDLKQRIHEGISPNLALDIFEHIADALRIAHQQGLIHRDIKPQNILFDSRDRPLLTDLGIAKAIGSDTRMTRTGMIIGTPHYMSPEQARGKRIDHRSDLYSLGVVFYEMLTGSVPYEAEDTFAVGLMHINDPIPRLPQSLAIFQTIIDRLMAKNPVDRFSNANQLLSTIRKMRSGESIANDQDMTQTLPRNDLFMDDDLFTELDSSSQGPRKGLGILGGVLAFLVVAGGIYLFQQSQETNDVATQNDAPQQHTITLPTTEDTSDADNASPEPDGSERAESALQREIDRLLEMANEDLEANRLTRPEGNNASDRYKAVLALDSTNEKARQGLMNIVEKYIEMSDNAIEKREFEQADQHLFNASIVIPSADNITNARRRLALAEETERKRQVTEEAEETKRLADQEAAAERERIAAQEAEAAERELIAAQKAEKAKRAAYESQITAGNTALEAVDKVKALSSFEAALVLYPGDPAARTGFEKAKALVTEPKHGDRFTNSLQMTFSYIESGIFLMGSSEDESGRDADELPHRVNLTKGYWLQTTEVTQKQWTAIMEKNPSRFSDCGANCPVESISWEDIQVFLSKLNLGDDKVSYRLPTEAEWEYGARAGSLARYCFGDTKNSLSNYSWYDRNAGGKTHPAGEKRPNVWGFYDMYGNVWEWCQDWYGKYPDHEVNDPKGPPSGRHRVLRGGSWLSSSDMCRSAVRHSLSPNNRNFYLGFRLAANQLAPPAQDTPPDYIEKPKEIGINE